MYKTDYEVYKTQIISTTVDIVGSPVKGLVGL